MVTRTSCRGSTPASGAEWEGWQPVGAVTETSKASERGRDVGGSFDAATRSQGPVKRASRAAPLFIVAVITNPGALPDTGYAKTILTVDATGHQLGTALLGALRYEHGPIGQLAPFETPPAEGFPRARLSLLLPYGGTEP